MTRNKDESFGKKVRNVEKELAKGLIRWRLRRSGMRPPDEDVLDRGTERVIEEAHAIINRRGRSILDEMKQAKEEFQKAYRGEAANETRNRDGKNNKSQ